MTAGWIKIHRKLQKWELYKKPEAVALFIHLLLEANYTDTERLKKGQLEVTAKELSNDTGVENVSYWLHKMEKIGTISRTTNYKKTIITINKYDDYQVSESQKNKESEESKEENAKEEEEEGKKEKTETVDSEEKLKLNLKLKSEKVKTEIPQERSNDGASQTAVSENLKLKSEKVKTEFKTLYITKERIKERIYINIYSNISGEQNQKMNLQTGIQLPLKEGSIAVVSQGAINYYKSIYKSIDVLYEVQKMKVWLESNSKNLKTEKGILRFINSWLNRAEDNARAGRMNRTRDFIGKQKPSENQDKGSFDTDEFFAIALGRSQRIMNKKKENIESR